MNVIKWSYVIGAKNLSSRMPKKILYREASGISVEPIQTNTNDERKKKKKYMPKDKKKISDIVYGFHSVKLALQANSRICYNLFVATGLSLKLNTEERNTEIKEILDICENRNISLHYVDRRELDRLSNNNCHQGLCLEASSLPDLCYTKNHVEQKILFTEWLSSDLPLHHQIRDNEHCLWIYLDQIVDSRNMGAIIRSSYYLGVHNIMKSAASSSPISNVVSKTSSGIAEIFPIITLESPECVVKQLKQNGFTVASTVASTDKSAVPVQDFLPTSNTLLVMGNERNGVSPSLKELSDINLTIPVASNRQEANSLNVSVATGILIQNLLLKMNL